MVFGSAHDAPVLGAGDAPGGPGGRGLILPVVLIIVALLTMLALSFAFIVNAELSSVGTRANELQVRQAAESGIHRFVLMYRMEGHRQYQCHRRQKTGKASPYHPLISSMVYSSPIFHSPRRNTKMKPLRVVSR